MRERGRHFRRRRNGPLIPDWLFYLVTLTILGLWVTGIVLTWVAPNSFQLPDSLSGLVPAALFALYGGKASSDRRNDRDSEDDDE